jgi:hypothetical protein
MFVLDMATTNESSVLPSEEGEYQKDFDAFDKLPHGIQRLVQFSPTVYSAEQILDIYKQYGLDMTKRIIVGNNQKDSPTWADMVKFDLKLHTEHVRGEGKLPRRRRRRRK